MADSASVISTKNSEKSKLSNLINRTTSETLRLNDIEKGVNSPNSLPTNTPRKKTSFQITSVIVGSRASNDGGDDSADDLDESHAEDISEVLDNSRITDLENETPSYSEDTFSKDDVFFNASSSLVSAPVIPTSSQYGLAIVATPENSDIALNSNNCVNSGSVDGSCIDGTEVTSANVINLGVVSSKHDPEMRDMHPPAPRTERFKVVKIESTEPFKRGRWVCMDYFDQNIAQKEQNSVKTDNSESAPPVNSEQNSINNSDQSPVVNSTAEEHTQTAVASENNNNLVNTMQSNESNQVNNNQVPISNAPTVVPTSFPSVSPGQSLQNNLQMGHVINSSAPTQTTQQSQSLTQGHMQQILANSNQHQSLQPQQMQQVLASANAMPIQTQQAPIQQTMQQPVMQQPYQQIQQMHQPSQQYQSQPQSMPQQTQNLQQNQQAVPQQQNILQQQQTIPQQQQTMAPQQQSVPQQQQQQTIPQQQSMPQQQPPITQQSIPQQQQQSIPQQQQSIPQQQQPIPQQQQQTIPQQQQTMPQQQPAMIQQPQQQAAQVMSQQQTIPQQPNMAQQQQPQMQQQSQGIPQQQQTMPQQQQGVPQQQAMPQQQQYQPMPQQQQQQPPIMQQQMNQQQMQNQMPMQQVQMQPNVQQMNQQAMSQQPMMQQPMQQMQQQPTQMHQVPYSQQIQQAQPIMSQTGSQQQVPGMMQQMLPQQMQGYQQGQMMTNQPIMNIQSQPHLQQQYYSTSQPMPSGIVTSQPGMMTQGTMPQVSMPGPTPNLPPLQTYASVTSIPAMGQVPSMPQTPPIPTTVQYTMTHMQQTGQPMNLPPMSMPQNILPQTQQAPPQHQHQPGQSYAGISSPAQSYTHGMSSSSVPSAVMMEHVLMNGDHPENPTASLIESLNEVTASGDDIQPGDDAESTSGANAVAIDNKIEQAMDLVKSHLMYAVREEVEVLKEKISELMERIGQLEAENATLRAGASPETLAQLPPGSQSQTSNNP